MIVKTDYWSAYLRNLTRIEIALGLFLVLIGFMLSMLHDPPTYILLTIIACFVASGLLLIHALVDAFRPLKDLPIAIRNGDIVIEEHGVEKIMPVAWDISHDFGEKKMLRVEFKHKHSTDGIKFKKSYSVFARLNISGSGEQKTEIFKTVTNDLNLSSSVKMTKIILSLADDKIINNHWQSKYHILEVFFTHSGYKPIKKSVWIDRRGYCFYSKPKSWSDEKTNLLT